MSKPSKITAIYYLAYPDGPPPDLADAESEVRIEVGDENSSLNDFVSTYSLHVVTLGRLSQHMREDGWVCVQHALVVDRFDDQGILAAVESILPRIEELALKLS